MNRSSEVERELLGDLMNRSIWEEKRSSTLEKIRGDMNGSQK